MGYEFSLRDGRRAMVYFFCTHGDPRYSVYIGEKLQFEAHNAGNPLLVLKGDIEKRLKEVEVRKVNIGPGVDV